MKKIDNNLRQEMYFDRLLDIKDKKIKKTIKELIIKLTKTKPNEVTYLSELFQFVDIIKMRSIKELEKELNEEKQEYEEFIKKAKKQLKIVKSKSDKDFLKYSIKTAEKELNTVINELREENSNTDAYVIETTNLDIKEVTDLSLIGFKIVLIWDNVKHLSNAEIRKTIGHEISHIYVTMLGKYKRLFGQYELDDYHFFNFLAEKWLRVNK